jgi:hypothetical protein
LTSRPWRKIVAAASLSRRILIFLKIEACSRNSACLTPFTGHAAKAFTLRRRSMKTITTLTAIAALIAGISVAGAQGMSSPQSSQPGGARLAAGSGKFCIEVSKGGSLQCKYASITACEKDAQAQGLQCSPNPNAGTTGSKN